MTDQSANTETANFTYQSLYKLGGVAACTAAALTLSEVILFVFYPQPGTMLDWFLLFQRNRLIGLIDIWGLEVPMYAMFTVVFLALHHILKKAKPGLMALATTFALLGIGVFFATNNPFSLLSLSDQYAAANTDAQRETLLAAGQALLTNTNQRAIGGFNMGLFLVSVAGLLVSWVMLQGPAFSRLTASVGILAHALSLADYLRQALTSSAAIALLVILPNALLLILWFILIGRRLYQLGQLETSRPAKQAHPKAYGGISH